jgi:type IV pilus assembly protein PilY1
MQVTQATCTTDMHATSADNCAAHFMSWEVGVTETGLPNRAGNVLGDIYHSTPVLVGPPSAALRDESYTDFVQSVVTRPIMLYTATNDGQLHAFKVAPAPGAASDPFKVDKWPAQNEIWSFFPPAVLKRIASQYSSTHQLLLDGPPVVADVVFSRSATQAAGGGSGSDWHTVLVAGFGSAGGGYYAVDITNPVPKLGDPTSGPRLLWQLTTDAAQKRLFGLRSGVPTITTLYFDPTGGSNPKQYAVAILPGGQSDGPTGAQCNQKGTNTYVDGGYLQRAKVQCWTADAAKSVTIVMLETGQIVRTFRDKDTPASLNDRAMTALGTYAELNAPMTGQAVVYPAGDGAVADRAFLGDGDGMLWRIDLSPTNPKEWSIDLFFDAYTLKTWNAGQPIVTAPILSVDRLGAVTVDFSTGDQETFTPSTTMVNYVWALREDPSTFKSQVEWFSELANGTRVAGPMVLYSSVLYYTTLTPTPINDTNRCSAGSSQLCGVSYVVPKTTGSPGDGGEPALVDPPGSNTLVQCMDLDGIAFGPTVQQQPTCSSEDSTYEDPYLGWGTHTRLYGGISGGKTSLVVMTTNTKVGAQPKEIELPPPKATARIDSWAAVIE